MKCYFWSMNWSNYYLGNVALELFNIVLNIGHTDLFNTVSQYLTLEWFKVAFLYQAYNTVYISCPFPLWSGECSPHWLEGVGWWNFPDVCGSLETILSHLGIKVDFRSDTQCNTSRSHVLATHSFYPKYG